MTANTPGELAPARPALTARIGNRARYANVVLGTWVFLSATLLPHTMASGANNWIVGILVAAFALMAIVNPVLHWANVLVALWLFCSTLWLLSRNGAALWNDIVAAVLVFFFALLPTGQPEPAAHEQHPAGG